MCVCMYVHVCVEGVVPMLGSTRGGVNTTYGSWFSLTMKSQRLNFRFGSRRFVPVGPFCLSAVVYLIL